MNTTTDRFPVTDRLLSHDVLPCEDEGVPEVIGYVPEVAPRIGRGVKLALVTLAYIVGTVAAFVVADWIFTRNGF